MKVIKRHGEVEDYKFEKVIDSINRARKAVSYSPMTPEEVSEVHKLTEVFNQKSSGEINSEEIRDLVEAYLNKYDKKLAKSFKVYNETHKNIRSFVKTKQKFIEDYKKCSNNANGTIDDNSNVSSKNIGTLNNEIHKSDNIEISRGMVMNKLKELYPEFDEKSYIRDLQSHVIYKHDESSFAGAVAPYCVSVSMYPFLQDGIKGLGGLSAKPKNLDSFIGIFINFVFAVSAQFAG